MFPPELCLSFVPRSRDGQGRRVWLQLRSSLDPASGECGAGDIIYRPRWVPSANSWPLEKGDGRDLERPTGPQDLSRAPTVYREGLSEEVTLEEGSEGRKGARGEGIPAGKTS